MTQQYEKQLQRYKVLAAGVLSMVVTLGVARFAYTPLLPIMQSQTGLTDAAGGWLAAFNYAGYMSGAALAMSINKLSIKDVLYKVYLLIAIVTTYAMSLTDNVLVWAVLRFLSGLSSSGGMLIASAIILNWLMKNNYRGELGVHFAGMGIGIIITSLLVEVMSYFTFTWEQYWFWCSIAAIVFAIPAWRWIPHTSSAPSNQYAHLITDNPPHRYFLPIMLVAYFCAGYGYVISATFIVDIIESQNGLEGNGSLVFFVVGIAIVPAAVIWDKIARKIGYLHAIFLAYVIQIIGVILPAISQSLSSVIIGCLLYGGTFIGCVSLVLTMAGQFYPSKPAKLMGKLTLTYGTAQIIAPALTGTIAQETGNYDLGLYLASGILGIGSLLIIVLIIIERSIHKNTLIAE
ncbi:YbfB/YjiJ family MFS transporter [Vibrio sp. WJH972]